MLAHLNSVTGTTPDLVSHNLKGSDPTALPLVLKELLEKIEDAHTSSHGLRPASVISTASPQEHSSDLSPESGRSVVAARSLAQTEALEQATTSSRRSKRNRNIPAAAKNTGDSQDHGEMPPTKITRRSFGRIHK